VRKWSQHSEEERGSQHSEERGVNIVRKGESTPSLHLGIRFKDLIVFCSSIFHIFTVPSQLDDACRKKDFVL
jgi:hypothetical protein